MDFYPFFRNPYYYAQNRYVNPAYRNMQRRSEQDSKDLRGQTSKTSKNSHKYSKEEQITNRGFNIDKKSASKCEENPIFEIFGIRLFFDDILIISLIFFLYNEGVRDNLLFISLILILLS